jgi:uncharacterized protein (DUF2267 family)
MDTRVLLDILKTRVISLDNNPTKKTVTKEVIKALERLIEYERNDEIKKKLSS